MDSIKKLQQLFAQFPTIGTRTAGRFVSYLIQQPQEKIDELLTAIKDVKQNVKLCSFCFNPFESTGELCSICSSPARNRQLLCIVEKEADLATIENTRKYTGLYFILGSHGARLENLLQKLAAGNYTEIILALNPTLDGKSTSAAVRRTIKERLPQAAFRITHLAQGLPVGGELEYADEETLESAFEGRK